MYGTLNRNISERSLTTRCQKFYFHKIQVVNFTLDITTGVTHCKIIQLIPGELPGVFYTLGVFFHILNYRPPLLFFCGTVNLCISIAVNIEFPNQKK